MPFSYRCIQPQFSCGQQTLNLPNINLFVSTKPKSADILRISVRTGRYANLKNKLLWDSSLTTTIIFKLYHSLLVCCISMSPIDNEFINFHFHLPLNDRSKKQLSVSSLKNYVFWPTSWTVCQEIWKHCRMIDWQKAFMSDVVDSYIYINMTIPR